MITRVYDFSLEQKAELQKVGVAKSCLLILRHMVENMIFVSFFLLSMKIMKMQKAICSC